MSRRNERGAVIVEAALVVPLMLALICGLVELALLMRDTVSVTGAVRAGARVASAAPGAGPGTCVASSNPPPCTPQSAPGFAQAAADAIQRAGSAMPADSIVSVMVYEANAAGFPLPATNRTLRCTTNCVTYVWDAPLNRFRFGSGSWASTSVNACVNSVAQTTIGVALTADHEWVTGLIFRNDHRIVERAVMRFEPLPAEQCLPGTHL